jgi:poly(glycerol-phosphate) alpha-glucosyltransferase
VIRPLKAALICPRLSRRGGGVPAAVIPLAAQLANESGLDIHLIGFEAPEDEPAVPCEVIAAFGPAKFPVAPLLGSRLRQGRYDIVHTHGLWTWASVAAASWARQSKRALFISPHGMLDNWALAHSRRRKQLALRLIERHHLARAFCFHALTEVEAASIIKAGFTQPIAVIPNGMDLPTLPATDPGTHLPAGLRGDGRRMLLFLGRLHPKKGIGPLLEAWAQVASRSPRLAAEWRLVIAGWDDGGHLDGFRQLAAACGITEHVLFCGPLFGEEKAAAYRHAGAFILPSFSEGLPMTILEAWSYGRPVFATEHCNLPEGFASGAALKITTNADEMAAALMDALDDPQRLAGVGRAGRSLLEQKFTWLHAARQWREVYAWAAGERNAPDCVLIPKSKAA